MPTRRAFLQGSAATLAAPAVGWSDVGHPVVLSAAMSPDGGHHLVGLTARGALSFRLPLPARGHAAAAHPHAAEAVAFARRPGTFALVLDCADGAIRHRLDTPPGHHFYGHGAFSADGTLLFTTENHVVTGEGRIGVWDRSLGYQRIAEFGSGGIGPHEIIRVPSGDLAVANGGLRTHPATGRQVLNLDTMRSNLTLLSDTGQVLDVAETSADTRLNSLRHIAADADGRILGGFQWQGDPFAAPPLVALYSGKGRLEACPMPEPAIRQLNGYIGSVACPSDTGFAATSPRGNRIVILDRQGGYQMSVPSWDICGVTALPGGGALATNGAGSVFRLSADGLEPVASHQLIFDNHLVAT